MKKSNGAFLENFQLTVFTANYILACILLFWLLSFLFPYLGVVYIVLISIVYLLLATVIWAHLFILFSIPQRLAGSFDYIKNEIAWGRLNRAEDYAKEIADFLIKFYNYSFFDIAISAVKIKEKEIKFSTGGNKPSLNWDEIEEKIAKEDKILFHGKIKIEQKNYYAYTIPIYFGDDYLGFFSVFSPRKLGKLRLRLLSELENHFIDDQLVHILNFQKNKE